MNFKDLNDDLVNMTTLDETNVLNELRHRYEHGKMYTYIGDILIALNPMRQLSIYDRHISDLYKNCDDNLRTKLVPHVFAIAELCYRKMLQTQKSQCILISGETGSGKTETCKYIVNHLLNRTKQYELCLNVKIQQVNPLLELFGNARTQINDNSSRFGKFLEIYFKEDGTVVGAKFKEYLLEKSRIVYQNVSETTFHIFYLLIFGMSSEEKKRLNLDMNNCKYRFIINKNSFLKNSDTIDNYKEKFNKMKKNMENIGFSNEDIDNLIRILISILQIGDITFKTNNRDDSVTIVNKTILQEICKQLELDLHSLHESLVSDVHVTCGETIRRERSMTQACDVRDALAKALYGRLFSWIVNQINHHIQPPEGILPTSSIGILDIFGFENFETNSFEQICINLANEQLHQLFTKYIFKLEIDECRDEGISLKDDDLISFRDNQIVLDMFLEKRNSIFALLDEESRFPKATDQSLAIKLHHTLAPLYSDYYTPPKDSGASFKIFHYAGQVNYNINGFLDKNRDFLPNNLFYCAKNSANPLVQELFACKLTRRGTIAPSDRQSRLRKSPFPVKSHTKQLIKYSLNSFSDQNDTKALPLTVACHFKNSLNELIDKISTRNIYFIRCIKPNNEQKANFIDSFVTRQLRYCSLMHVCKIRKCGYAYRIKFSEFLQWFSALSSCVLKFNANLSLAQQCTECLHYASIKNYRLGKTKVFLRYWHMDILNECENKCKKKIIFIQKLIRGWLVRRNYARFYQAQAQIMLAHINDKFTHFNELHTSSTAQIKVPFKNLKKFKREKSKDLDVNEINLTIREFDEMLFKYENENWHVNDDEIVGRQLPLAKIAYNPNRDNTLKQRNALVASEFKNLLQTNFNVRKTRFDDNALDNSKEVRNRFLSPTNRCSKSVLQNSPLSTSLVNMAQKENAEDEGQLLLKQSHLNRNPSELMLNKQSPESTVTREFENIHKIDESKRSVPEWKLKLLKQKESKRLVNTMLKNEDTPELMKHNIFIKKE